MAEEREPGDVTPPPTGERTDGWWRVLLIGGGLYLLSLGILVITGNPNLFPTVIILGSSLVPAAYVAFFYERRRLSRLSMPTVALTFFYGGVLGVLAAAALEPVLIDELTLLTAFLVGLIEEAAKILGVLVIARRRRHDTELDGLILGAAAGMGFATLESAGYAFTAFVRSGGSLSLTTGIIGVRAMLAPLGHGTWTAILATVIFREGHVTHFHLDRTVIGAYLLVSGLHGLWNGLPLLLSGVFDGAGGAFGQLLVGGAGLYLLSVTWQDAKRRQLERVEVGEVREE
jgi:RsiW-degrading membrane proteinase PrsW (M82 family)